MALTKTPCGVALPGAIDRAEAEHSGLGGAVMREAETHRFVGRFEATLMIRPEPRDFMRM